LKHSQEKKNKHIPKHSKNNVAISDKI
jgi:hypothetical protein